ncbi:MAG: ATP-binding cassette domain-containing protein, partial [Lentisphaeria bacterium]|nr:ATP-binding cassette domain-containing protein [Lentisphaeria bacterium]
MTIVPDSIPVQVRNLSMTFRQGANEIQALREVSLDIGTGDFVAVMGASGSGKSTLLHLIAGLTEPTSGSVEINGESLAGKSDRQLAALRRRQIGLVFQAFNLIPTLTAEDNVLLPLRLDGISDRRRAEEALAQVGLNGRRHHRPDTLSGGEQQRVAI